jgi:hypothetical protein
VGSTVFTGALAAAATALVAALVAGAPEPPEFAATTDTVNVLPTSAATGT